MNENGKFKLSKLPVQAQYSPVYAISVGDFNSDGNQDIVFSGNNSSMRLRFGKSDANYGILVAGEGKGNFKYIPQNQSGLQLRGDVRSTVIIKNKIYFAVNKGPLVAAEVLKK